MNNKPIQIVMTPVRNEVWILHAFLTATAKWADYIIIADQMSTDGSRELYKEYQEKWAKDTTEGHHCELIVIDNKNPEFNEAERQAMLVAKAREVAAGRDTLLWGLDADEVLAANAFATEDWQKILNSKPGAVFWFRWAQLTHDKKHFYNTKNPYPWLFHDDGVEPHGNYVRAMHSMRIPYPIEEKDMHYVEDFRVLHFGPAPLNRVRAKERFYMFVDWQVNNRPPYTMGRNYRGSNAYPNDLIDLPKEWIVYDGLDIFSLVNLDEEHCWMDDYLYDHLVPEKMSTIVKLPIWDKEFIDFYQMKDPRHWWQKMIHSYLDYTQSYKNNILVRAIDKLLRKL